VNDESQRQICKEEIDNQGDTVSIDCASVIGCLAIDTKDTMKGKGTLAPEEEG
jgi:hypothetical protein